MASTICLKLNRHPLLLTSLTRRNYREGGTFIAVSSKLFPSPHSPSLSFSSRFGGKAANKVARPPLVSYFRDLPLRLRRFVEGEFEGYLNGTREWKFATVICVSPSLSLSVLVESCVPRHVTRGPLNNRGKLNYDRWLQRFFLSLSSFSFFLSPRAKGTFRSICRAISENREIWNGRKSLILGFVSLCFFLPISDDDMERNDIYLFEDFMFFSR